MDEKYNLRREKEDVVYELFTSHTRRYEGKNDPRYENIDNCACPGCPCADGGLPAVIVAAGVGVLAATTPVMVAVTAAEAAAN